MTKMTYVQAIDSALAMFTQGGQIDPEDVEVVEKLTALRDVLAKRKSYKRTGPTKTQVANAELADKIVGYIEELGAPVTCAQVEVAFGLSNQKASAILNRSGRFVKVTEGKGKVKATFGIAD